MTAHGLAGDEISKRVTADMQQEAITAALTTILWRAACQRKGGEANANAIVALPEDPKSRGDPLVEGMELHSFRDKGALASFLARCTTECNIVLARLISSQLLFI